MRYTTFHKHTRTLMLLPLFFFITNILTAQLPTASFLTPLSIYFAKAKMDAPKTVSEFNNLSNNDLITKIKMPVDTPLVVMETSKNKFFQDSTCIDLAFDSVSIVNMTEKYIEIKYSIINKGTAPAPIFGSKRTNTDNVAVHFYYSGTPRLNRGSILAEGIYLIEGLRETKGMLAPNAVYTNRFKLSLEKKNRFYGVIILQLDAFDILSHECDETNNVFAIVPKWY
jgi:hypothetical protein